MKIVLELNKQRFTDLIKYEKRGIDNRRKIDQIWEWEGYGLDIVDKLVGESAVYVLFSLSEMGDMFEDEFYNDMNNAEKSVESIVEKYWPLFEMIALEEKESLGKRIGRKIKGVFKRK